VTRQYISVHVLPVHAAQSNLHGVDLGSELLQDSDLLDLRVFRISAARGVRLGTDSDEAVVAVLRINIKAGEMG